MFTYLRINLQAGELFVVDLAHAAHMSCESGELWLTHDRLSEDFEFKQGTRLALPKGKILIEGHGQLHFYGERAAMKNSVHIQKGSCGAKSLICPSYLDSITM
ncbi:DUF2917 domain-containing protein [Iodobacter sp. LRB]|uniref:DUF2917 domain-containing protein n=1 Tax=unclassified Iodobacter TaxID=235634 RepID=UPI0015D47FBF|nr:DUF2917 domain-containing protein [Iodobacter sp. BJB302]